jgi:outer membrane lipoprotein-sorting protein
MPLILTPFGVPESAGEGEVVGRKCTLLEFSGRYEGGDITITYWIDKEENILLKKEHKIYAGGPLAYYSFECTSIEIDPEFDKKIFSYQVPSDWIKVKRNSLETDFLDTHF